MYLSRLMRVQSHVSQDTAIGDVPLLEAFTQLYGCVVDVYTTMSHPDTEPCVFRIHPNAMMGVLEEKGKSSPQISCDVTCHSIGYRLAWAASVGWKCVETSALRYSGLSTTESLS